MALQPIELLAPARDLEVGKAAIDCGADAVYIGAAQFGARSKAGNSLDDIALLVNYAHRFGAKVWVTLNTLLSVEEQKQAVQLAWQLYEVGVDGLILQDFHLLQFALPPLQLHASTQCDNRSAAQLQLEQQAGFCRAVLARELSLEQIQALHQACDIDLECFIHGAVCVSYSGRCYLSERLCQRSANRGECAQLCRMPYDLLDAQQRPLQKGKYLLSLHDMDRTQDLEALLQAGVTSLKIEGRLKGVDYVRNITAWYRTQLDALFARPNSPYCRASFGQVNLDFAPQPQKSFHRGQTAYFLHGREANMSSPQTPKSTGEKVGTVTGCATRGNENWVEIRPLSDSLRLQAGDGLCYSDQGFALNKVVGNRLYPARPLTLPLGTVLYRNYDAVFNAQILKSQASRRLEIALTLQQTGERYALKIQSLDTGFAFTYPLPQGLEPAQNATLALRTWMGNLSKLGDTVYAAASVQFEGTVVPFAPLHQINEIRRQALTLFAQASIEKPTWTPSKIDPVAVQKLIEEQTQPVEAYMTCRFCLLYELGQCRKKGDQTGTKPEPKYLRTTMGQLLQLHFDCQKCEMRLEPVH